MLDGRVRARAAAVCGALVLVLTACGSLGTGTGSPRSTGDLFSALPGTVSRHPRPALGVAGRQGALRRPHRSRAGVEARDGGGLRLVPLGRLRDLRQRRSVRQRPAPLVGDQRVRRRAEHHRPQRQRLGRHGPQAGPDLRPVGVPRPHRQGPRLRLGDPAVARVGALPAGRGDRHHGGAVRDPRPGALHRPLRRSGRQRQGERLLRRRRLQPVAHLRRRLAARPHRLLRGRRGAVPRHGPEHHPGQADAPGHAVRPGPQEGLDPRARRHHTAGVLPPGRLGAQLRVGGRPAPSASPSVQPERPAPRELSDPCGRTIGEC